MPLFLISTAMRDEQLEDVTTNRVFLYVSEIDTVCDEIGVHEETVPGPVVASVYAFQVVVEEFSKNPSTKAASKPSAVTGGEGAYIQWVHCGYIVGSGTIRPPQTQWVSSGFF